MNKKSLILGAHPAWKSRKFQGFAAWACSRDKDSAPASWLCATWERASLIVRQNDERARCELRSCFHFSRRSFVFRAVLMLSKDAGQRGRTVIFFARGFAVDPGDGRHVSYKINHSAHRANLVVTTTNTSNGERAIILRASRVRSVGA